MNNLGDIFTNRQLQALTTFSDLVQGARERAAKDAWRKFARQQATTRQIQAEMLRAQAAVKTEDLTSLKSGSADALAQEANVRNKILLVNQAIAAEERAGSDGRIAFKTNGLTDPDIIDALYRASRTGVSIDLVVRGLCCLRPGVPGLSDNIRVRSIVGRHLEHARIFRFGGVGGRPLLVGLGSPDLMERNLDRRVEVVVPVDDPAIQERLVAILDAALADRANAWELGSDRHWHRLADDDPSEGPGFNLQDHFQTLALESLRSRRDASQRDAAALRSVPAAGPVPDHAQHPVPGPVPARVPALGPEPPGGAARAPRWWHRLLRRRPG